MMEELLVEDGRVTNLSFGDYKLPTTADIPPLKTVLSGPRRDPASARTTSRASARRRHARRPPAIANAVEDAVGARIRDLPVTAEKVYAALQEQ